MERCLLLILCWHLLIPGQGQNLVPNGGFEQHDTCYQPGKNKALPIRFASGWYAPSYDPVTWAHACYVNIGAGNFFPPKVNDPLSTPWRGHTGQACAYVSCGQLNDQPPSSSYAAIQLSQPLVTGKMYCFSVYIRAYTNNEQSVLKSNGVGFGVYLSPQPLRATDLAQTAFSVKPQLVNHQLFSIQWDRFQGCIQAQGGEQYMTLGFFNNDIMALPRVPVPVTSTQTDLYRGGQAMIDDVSLVGVEANQLLGADTSLCAGSSITLRTHFQCAKTFQWSTGSTDSTLSVKQAGTYWLQVTTDCGSLRDTIQVRLRANGLDLGPDTTLCAGQSFTLQVPPSASSIRWDDDSSLPTRTVSQPGTYWVRLEQNGCDLRDEISLRAASPPQLHLPLDTVRCEDEPALVLRVGPPSYSYQWADGPIDSVRALSGAGTYRVRASNGCGSVEEAIQLRVSDCACRVWWPTAFSPNGDGINDEFRGFLDCPVRPSKSLYWQVYNRWGNVIYRSESLQAGWNGQADGIAMPAGVYPYQLWVTSGAEGREQTHTSAGTVHLVR